MVVSAKKPRHNHSHEDSPQLPDLLRVDAVFYFVPKDSCGQSAGKEDEFDAEKLSGAQKSHGGPG